MAFGDILGGLLEGGAAAAGGYLGGAPGFTAGLAGGQRVGDFVRSYFKQPSAEDLELAQLRKQMSTPYQEAPINYDALAQAEQRRYQQEIIPGLAERFTGSGGGQRSSAFRQALAGAGTDLAARLAELKTGFQERQQQAGRDVYGLNQQRMSSLANLLQGRSQQQQAAQEAQQNRYHQMAGMLPKAYMDNQRLEQDQYNDFVKNYILTGGQGLQGQKQQQDFRSRLYEMLTGKTSDTVTGRVPSNWELFGNTTMDLLKEGSKILQSKLGGGK